MTSIERRLEAAERQLCALQLELAELRALAAAEAAAPPAAPPQEPRVAAPLQPPGEPSAGEARPWERPVRERLGLPSLSVPRIDAADLLGARGLAWAGGIVTVLGVVFLFVLAVNRGWVGPVERVAFGALASTAAVGAGFLVRSRYGQYHSALAAVGAGIAGGYATLLAAVALYELLPRPAALAVALGIAAVGVAISLLWQAQLVAALGLVGATLAPGAIALDEGVSVVGTGFAGLVFAGTVVVSLRQSWRPLLLAGVAASAPQAIALAAVREGDGRGGALGVALGLAAVYLAAGIAVQHADGKPERAGIGLILGSAAYAFAASAVLLEGWEQHAALLAIAGVYGALAAAFFAAARRTSSTLALAGLALGAIALADTLDGTTLAIVWAAEAAALAWLARLVREPRYELGAFAYLVLAAVHAVAIDAPLEELYRDVAAPAARLWSVVAVAAAAALAAAALRKPSAVPAGGGFVERLLEELAGVRDELRAALGWVAAVAAAYAAALGTLELTEAAGVRESFAWGHVGVTGLWAVAGGALLAFGALAERSHPYVGGVAWLSVVLAHLVTFDLETLPEPQRAWTALAFAAPALAAGYVAGTWSSRRAAPLGAVAASALFAAVTAVDLGGAGEQGGWALLGAGGAYAALAASALPRAAGRDLATLLWALALALGLAGSVLLVDGTELALAWTVTAVVLGLLATLLSEGRFQPAAGLFGLLAVGLTLVVVAPPTELFAANADPAEGVPALAAVVSMAVAFVVIARHEGLGSGDALDRWLDGLQPAIRLASAWAAAALALYAASLGVLGAVLWVGDADLDTEFQRGHTAVSVLWGAVGLSTLALGLGREARPLRLAGFGLLGLSLAKLFLYDLSQLSSMTRVVSFLGVGAILLAAGFFYQRLAGRGRAVAG